MAIACKCCAEMRKIRCAGPGYLPAYRPDRNPIERRFRKRKAWLRKAKARTIAGRIEARGDALRGVRPSDLLGGFRQSGDEARSLSDTVNKKPL